jgi:hypothetical protein
MQKSAKKFRSFAEAEKADRDFYKKLTGNERLQILVDLLGPLQGDGRIDRNCVKRRKLGEPEFGKLSDCRE